MRKIFVSGIVLLISISSFCQKWKNYLPSVQIESIELRDSILWINSESYIAKYNIEDGSKKYIHLIDSIPKPNHFERNTLNYAVASNANLIVNIYKKGLFELSGEDNWVKYDENNTNISIRDIYDLKYDRSGILWFSDNKSYLFKRSDSLLFDSIFIDDWHIVDFTFDINNNPLLICVEGFIHIVGNDLLHYNFRDIHLSANAYSRKIQFDSNNKFWILETTSEELIDSTFMYSFDGENWKKENEYSNTFSNNPIKFIIDDEDRKWFLFHNNVKILEENNWTTINLISSLNFTDLAVVNRNKFYVASNGYGLLTYDNGKINVSPVAENRLPGAWVSVLKIDNESRLWIGTKQYLYGNSAFSLLENDEWYVNNRLTKEIPSAPSVSNNIFQDSKNNLYSIVPFRKLYVFDGLNWTSIEKPYENRGITDMVEDSEGNLWFTNYHSIYKLNGTDLKPIYETTPENYEQYIAIDGDGAIWAIDYKSISKYQSNSTTVYSCNTPMQTCGSPGYTDVAVDAYNNIWITSGDGITMYNGEKWTQYKFRDQLNGSNTVSKVYIDNDNIKYFGSHTSGLIIYDNTDWFYINKTNSAIANNSVWSITANDSTVCVGTLNGISMFSKSFKGNTFSISESDIIYKTTKTSISKGLKKCSSLECSLNFYPNPVQNTLTIDFFTLQATALTISLVEINGKKTSISINDFCEIGDKKYQLDLSLLNPGVYILIVKTDSEVVNKRIMVHHK